MDSAPCMTREYYSLTAWTAKDSDDGAQQTPTHDREPPLPTLKDAQVVVALFSPLFPLLPLLPLLPLPPTLTPPPVPPRQLGGERAPARASGIKAGGST